MSTESNKKFVLNAKHLFLTYSQVLDLTHEDVINQLRLVLPIKNFLICREPHKDGNYHFHVYLEFDRRFCIKNANKLYLLDKNSNWIHGHYEAMKNQKATIAYITKLDKNYLTSLDLDLSGEKKTSEYLFWEKLVKITTNESVEKAMDYLVCTRPDLVGKRYNAIEKNLFKYSQSKKKNDVLPYRIIYYS
jgi:hypothetical protein